MNIDISVSPDAFEFRSPRRNLVLKTFVYVTRDLNGFHVGGFSDNQSRAAGTAVPLFEEPCDVPNVRPILLTEFLQHGILYFRGEFWLIKPAVTFRNIRSLDPVLHGYQEMLLEPLAIKAGARKVTFISA